MNLRLATAISALSMVGTLLSSALAPALAQAPRSPTPSSTAAPIRAVTFAKGLQYPWGLAFLPDGRLLVTERDGTLRIIDRSGQLSPPLAGVPKVYARGQGGLLDVALSPGFEQDRFIYLAFSEPDARNNSAAGTAVARATLGPGKLENTRVIWRQTPKVDSPNHWGSRLVFRSDGTLFMTLGDRYNQRPLVQDLSTTIGKVVRINADGSIPKDNPFINRKGARPEIWSYGHRNVQAAALQSETQELWTVEHGARGGDELNNPKAGRNYGWPIITYGVDYSGERIGEGVAKKDMEQPVYFWDPVIAPSGATFYTGNVFPDWRGDLFIGSLTPGCLVRLRLNKGRVTQEERYLGDLHERIRDVVQGPDGFLYLLTDNPNGRVLRVEPSPSR